jgi:transposase
MVLPGPGLPDDVDALKAMIIALNAEKAATDAEIARMKAVQQKADERITTLTAILKVLQRAQNGTRSERLRLAINDEQIDFAFEEVETGLAAIDSELGQAGKERPKREARPRKGFAAHLERIEEVIEPEIPDDCQGLEKVLIGEDRSERPDVIPPKFRVIVTRRPKYASRERDGVLQALASPHIIEGGLPSERLLAALVRGSLIALS